MPFLFITAIISILATMLTVYLLCKPKTLSLHQVKEVGTVTQKEINTECKTLTYIGLVWTILGLVMVAILHYRKSKLCRGCIFSNTVRSWYSYQMYNIMQNHRGYPFVQNHRHAKTWKHEIKSKLYLGYFEKDWKEVSVTFNDNKINLPRVVTIKLKDKIKIRCMMKKVPLAWILQVISASGNHGEVEVNIKMMRGIHTFRRDQTTQVISCNPWNTRLHPYPSLIQKIKNYLELEGKPGNQLHTNIFSCNKNSSPRKIPVPKKAEKKIAKVTVKRRFKVIWMV